MVSPHRCVKRPIETYCRESSAGEYKPRETRQLHFLCTSFTDDLAADQAKSATFDRDKLGHPACSLGTGVKWQHAWASREGGQPTCDENLWVLGIEMGLEPRL